MRIESNDRRSWLELFRHGDENYSSFTVRCAVEFGRETFVAGNNDLHFQNENEFLETLDRFILDRSLQPTLLGTYNTSLKVWRPGTRNDVMLNFAIGDAYCGWAAHAEFKLEGSFPIDQEDLNALLVGLRSSLTKV